MKEKILSALKTACGTTTSISDKTLQIFVDNLSATITEESQIDAAIELLKPVLQAIDGNINHVTAEAVKKVKPADKPQDKSADKPATDPNEPEWFKSYREKQDQETLALKNKLEGYDKEKTTSALSAKVKGHEKLKEVPEWFLEGRNITPETEDGVDQVVNGIEALWNKAKQQTAEQGVFISVPKSPAAGLKEGEVLGASIAEKRNAGTSEGVQGKKIV